MPYGLLAIVSGVTLIGAIIAFILYLNRVRLWKTREELETEEGLCKTFGDRTKWGLPGAIDEENQHSHHADSGGAHDGGHGGDDGGGF